MKNYKWDRVGYSSALIENACKLTCTHNYISTCMSDTCMCVEREKQRQRRLSFVDETNEKPRYGMAEAQKHLPCSVQKVQRLGPSLSQADKQANKKFRNKSILKLEQNYVNTLQLVMPIQFLCAYMNPSKMFHIKSHYLNPNRKR